MQAIGNDLEPNVLAADVALLGAVLSAPVNDYMCSHTLLGILWSLVDGKSVGAEHSCVRRIIEVAGTAAKQSHGGGRRDALRIIDWAEDNL